MREKLIQYELNTNPYFKILCWIGLSKLVIKLVEKKADNFLTTKFPDEFTTYQKMFAYELRNHFYIYSIILFFDKWKVAKIINSKIL